MVNKKNFKKSLEKLKKNGIGIIIKEHEFVLMNGAVTVTIPPSFIDNHMHRPVKPEDLVIFTHQLPSEIYTEVNCKLQELKYYKKQLKKFKQFEINKNIKRIIDEVYK